MFGLIYVYLCLICLTVPSISGMSKGAALKIKAWNVRGYLSATPYLRHLLEDTDVLCISEHWLHGNRHHVLDQISTNHSVHARSSSTSSPENYGSGRGQGGLLFFGGKQSRVCLLYLM